MAEKRKNKSTKAIEIPTRFTDDFLSTMDGRGEVTRTLRQRLGQLVADLGGFSNLSYMEQSLCKRIVHLERSIEKRELSLAHGGECDETVYLSSINVLSGLFGKIGLKRRARKIQSLEDYLKRPPPEPQPAPPPAPSGPSHKEDSDHGN